jgi:hypothetical protein
VYDYLGTGKGALDYLDQAQTEDHLAKLRTWCAKIDDELERGNHPAIFASFADEFRSFFTAVEAAGGPLAFDVELAVVTSLMGWLGMQPIWVRLWGAFDGGGCGLFSSLLNTHLALTDP